ncbi:MAG: VOC family protein [Cyanobacteria bacterium J06628_6]
MNFAYTILYVENVPQSIEFYRQAFGLKRKMIHESGDYGELATGTTTLAFASRKMMADQGKSPVAPSSVAPTFEIALTTQDVPAAINRAVKAGATLVQDATAMPWGQTIAYVTDNSGFMVELCTPISESQDS